MIVFSDGHRPYRRIFVHRPWQTSPWRKVLPLSLVIEKLPRIEQLSKKATAIPGQKYRCHRLAALRIPLCVGGIPVRAFYENWNNFSDRSSNPCFCFSRLIQPPPRCSYYESPCSYERDSVSLANLQNVWKMFSMMSQCNSFFFRKEALRQSQGIGGNRSPKSMVPIGTSLNINVRARMCPISSMNIRKKTVRSSAHGTKRNSIRLEFQHRMKKKQRYVQLPHEKFYAPRGIFSSTIDRYGLL